MNTNNILNVFYHFWQNLLEIFSWRNLRWHLLAIGLTYLIIMIGFDWTYYELFRRSFLYPMSFSAALVGALVPILFPLILFLVAAFRKNKILCNTALASGQAAILGSLISSLYKSVTGRSYPIHDIVSNGLALTKTFHFSWFQSGIFWGWPSSHTTIAFAMAVTLVFLYPSSKKIRFFSWVYAFYIGLLVAMSIHWFSDFVAGAIIGTVIGVVVGKTFQLRQSHLAAKLRS